MFIKLDTKFDIQKLKAYVDFVKNQSPPFMKKQTAWGGWSVTSSDGTISDGWQGGERFFVEGLSEEEKEKIKKEFESKVFNKPTPLFTPLIQEILDEVRKMDFQPMRVRLVVLKPHEEKEAYWHQDGKSAANYFKLRLHIPIITNSLCTFEYPDKKYHLSADGSAYIIEVSKPHRVLNLSNEERYHLMMDIYSDRD